MSLTQDDLSAIALIVKNSISGLENDMSEVKSRLDEHDKRFDNIDSSITSINERLDTIDGQIDIINGHLDTINGRLDTLENDVSFIKVVQLENNVIPRLDTIEDCYLDTYKRYSSNNDKFEAAFSNIDLLNQIVKRNSADIVELKMLQKA